MTGIEKTAALMVALGPDVASSVLQHLDEDTVSRIAEYIAKIEDLSVEDKEDLIGDFLIELRKTKNSIIGGEKFALDLLKSAFGEKRANEILDNLTKRDIEKGFEYLKNIDPKTLANLLENEHPQTITVTLSHLPPDKSAGILQNIPPFIGKEVIKRMATIEKMAPDAVLEIARVLRKKHEHHQESNDDFNKIDGIATLIDIMNQMNPDHEKRLMDYFDSNIPSIYDEIRDNIFSFDNILNLTHLEIQILIDEINDDYLIIKALKGVDDEIKFKIFRNMSLNRATDILNEINKMGPIRLTEIHDARNKIVSIMRSLNDNGAISIKKDKEIYVE